MSDLDIIPYAPNFHDEVVNLAIAAWTPVFAKTRNEVPGFVYEAFYPQGWEARQAADVASLLESQSDAVWLALQEDVISGFVGIRHHPEDQMGEIHILAVSPDKQRQGVGRALLTFAENEIRDCGMKMVMVETAGDSGHASARRIYESFGYRRWPVARYFKPL